MDASTVAAWWGAGVATSVLMWDVFKFARTGPRLTVTVVPGTIAIPADPTFPPTMIMVKVVNRGDAPTTITTLCGESYAGLGERLRRKGQSFVVMAPVGGPGLPFPLGPGQEWVGCLNQADVVAKMGSDGLLYCGVAHTMRSKPVHRRVRLK